VKVSQRLFHVRVYGNFRDLRFAQFRLRDSTVPLSKSLRQEHGLSMELTEKTGVYSCRVAAGVGIIKTRRNSLSSPRYLSFEPRSLWSRCLA
jgi:hypothetical protein